MNNQYVKPLMIFSLVAVFEIANLPITSAHDGHNHPSAKTAIAKEGPTERFSDINASYKIATKALLLKACGDCHSRFSKMPWYSGLPVIRRYMASDIQEAKKHLDLSEEFPFKGHGSPEEDLRAIDDVIRKKTMPPWDYDLLHSSQRLSETERTTILDWANESLALLTSQNPVVKNKVGSDY
ncbi:MAG: hypothetical protein EOP04_29300 [Proteobacteria bacterium]|nr:MAG: hypothetical protein EOP04_29300 [Pseudomonadota bacterium]